MSNLRHEPDGLEEADFGFSNLNHEMPQEADKLLRDGRHWMPHTAWDHWGCVWFQDGQFHERVMRYHVHVETVSADTIRELVSKVNERWGSY